MEPRAETEMETFLIRMQSHVKNEKLSGQVLKHRTGNLKRSLHEEVFRAKDALVGVLATGKQAPYARPHEYGGTFSVKAHRREIRMAFGRKIDPVTVDVRAHTIKLPERSFMRTTLAEFAKPFKALLERIARMIGRPK